MGKRAALLLLLIGSVANTASAGTPTLSQINKRLTTVENTLKTLTTKTKTLTTGQQALSGSATSLGSALDDLSSATSDIQDSVDQLEKTVTDLVQGNDGKGSKWNGKTVTPSSTAGFTTTTCTVDFTSDSADGGTFSSNPYFCGMAQNEWTSLPLPVTGHYKVQGSTISFFNFSDPGMVLGAGDSMLADVTIDGDGNLTMVITNEFVGAKATLTPR